jgi:tripartite-type tricarboxylate transporter receptor subunit TctC
MICSLARDLATVAFIKRIGVCELRNGTGGLVLKSRVCRKAAGDSLTKVARVGSAFNYSVVQKTALSWVALPDIPTVADFVPGYEASFWTGIGAPKNAPADIVDKLNREINAGLADPKIKARMADLGGTGLALSPADFGKLIAEETEKWGKVVKFVGIKAD